MLVLVVLCLMALVAIFMMLMSFLMMSVKYHSEEHAADRISLEVSQFANDENRMGALNDMTSCARQLIFNSHESLMRTTESRNKQFEPLAEQLLAESRGSAGVLENEHRHQITLTLDQIRDYIVNVNRKHRSASQFDSVIFDDHKRKVVEVEVGAVQDIPSNAQAAHGACPLLDELDADSKLTDTKSGFYFPNPNAKLVYDDDLKFPIDSLAPPIDGCPSPSRLMSASSFKPMAKIFDNGIYKPHNLDLIPSAVRVVEEIEVDSAPGMRQTIRVSSIATTCGALPPLWEKNKTK